MNFIRRSKVSLLYLDAWQLAPIPSQASLARRFQNSSNTKPFRESHRISHSYPLHNMRQEEDPCSRSYIIDFSNQASANLYKYLRIHSRDMNPVSFLRVLDTRGLKFQLKYLYAEMDERLTCLAFLSSANVAEAASSTHSSS